MVPENVNFAFSAVRRHLTHFCCNPKEEVQKGSEEMKSALEEEMESTPGKHPAYKLKEGPPKLSLPGNMQQLLDHFEASDMVVGILYNRQETITFSKLKAAVEEMTHKNFGVETLGQIKTVYPTAYAFSQEKGLRAKASKCRGYQLTIQPNLAENGLDDSLNSNGWPRFSATALLQRTQRIQRILTDIVIKHHADFLSRLDPPLAVPASKLTHWHPHFLLETVPDIEPSPLPTPPMKKVHSASQILQGNIPKRIRAKESAKTLTRDPAEDQKRRMMGRLPALIRTLWVYYVTQKKPALQYTAVVMNLAESYPTAISLEDVEACILKIEELAPEWLQVIKISRGKYIKINKNIEINKVITKIKYE